jgi:3-oxoacyl-[acyl-carrier protein] reductase
VHRCNVACRAEVDAIAAQIGPVDVLVDAAEIWPHEDWMSPDWSEAFDRVIDVNLRGPIYLVRAFIPGIIERRYGRIVLCGSIAGWAGGLMSIPHYVASKGGIHALVRWFTQQAQAHGVCVNRVAPGPVATPMTHGANHDRSRFRPGRLAEPREVAHVMRFLCILLVCLRCWNGLLCVSSSSHAFFHRLAHGRRLLLLIFENHVGSLLGDQDDGGVGIARHELRHDRRIDHA